jgi:tetratricopeptide (TPR) repeat protein
VAARPALLALRIECLDALQQRAEAWRVLERALQDHPQAVELFRTRARLRFHEEKFAEAVPDLEWALKADRHDYLSRFQLTQALEALGKRAEASEQRRLAEESRAILAEVTRLSREVIARPWDADLQNRIADLCIQVDRHDLAAMWRKAALASPGQKVPAVERETP